MLNLKRFNVGKLQTNCYLLFNNEKVVLIDPGDDFELISGFLGDSSLKLECVILTHAHFDHIGALQKILDFYGATVIMNKSDESLLYDPSLNLSCHFPGDDIVCNPEKIHFVEDNEKLNILGFDFLFYHTPGHSPGSLCIAVDKFLFTGDTLFYRSIGNAFPPYGNTSLEINSIIDKLYTLDFNYLCLPGHGESTYLDDEKNNNPYTRGV